ncbi:Methionine ABC transporter permease protein [Alkalibacterium sp. AK22]|uniref:methionine ABC transporter permease n=1 Tax=Alkalibacterium sp. AK22 TaxID=1229520 RepID=UPI000450C225|nr:ABC transporter permease subunit [Alkalibacterium sp. AK22]EXJ24079.1 Methionine ABC transporter permease protein [Alkalibacterium sp. AK22]
MNVDRSLQVLERHLFQAIVDTAYMVGVSAAIALVIGVLLGLLMYLTGHPLLIKNRSLYGIVGFVINAVRSLPFIILMFALSPVAVAITGRQIGWQAATVSLSIAATAFFSRIAEAAFLDVDRGVIEASIATGASLPLILWEVVIPEALPALIRGISLTLISLIGFSAMAGAIGAGGIGDLAIQYGYNMYDDVVMLVTVVILIVIVQLLQLGGDLLAQATSKK